MMKKQIRTHYSAVAVTLHWLIAVAILANIPVGYLMDSEGMVDRMQQFALFQIHKSIGLTVLVLSLLRLVWRLIHKPPPLSAHLKRWEVVLAHLVHRGFYVLMIVVPLLGWAAVSVAPIGIPTLWFTLFRVPHLPYLGELSRADKAVLYEPIGDTHTILAYAMLFLFVLHVAGALKHQFLDRDGEMARMIPWLRKSAPASKLETE
jgi:cytochrome b561